MAFLLSGLGLAGVLFALSQGPEIGWTAGRVLVTGVGGVLCFVLLVVAERRTAFPMLDLGLLRGRVFRMANIIAFSLFAAQNGIIFLIPLFLQDLRGLSALEAGLITFVQPLATIAMVQFTSRAYARLGPRPNLIICTSVIVATSILLMMVDLQTNLWWIRGIMLLRGAGGAFWMVSVQTTAFATVSRERMGRASSLFSTQRQAAGSFGVAILATVLISRTQALTAIGVTGAAAQQASLRAFHDAFAVAALLGLVGIAFALQIRNQDVHPSPRPRHWFRQLVGVGQRRSLRQASDLRHQGSFRYYSRSADCGRACPRQICVLRGRANASSKSSCDSMGSDVTSSQQSGQVVRTVNTRSFTGTNRCCRTTVRPSSLAVAS